MSFIKVKDPRKREELIRDFIETRKGLKITSLLEKWEKVNIRLD